MRRSPFTGFSELRTAGRQPLVVLSQLPPLRTCSVPDVSRGSVADPCGYGPYGSAHHSHTLPSMSYSPHLLGFLRPTSCVFRSLLPLNQANSSTLPLKAPAVPALQAYSHCASVGNSRPSFLQNCCTSTA